jgi:SAM-dependent methyltransferase
MCSADGNSHSYRDSHLGAAKAIAYDEDLWDPAAAKGLEWLVEQRLLTGLLRAAGDDTAAGPAARPGGTADFACGTGRVLQFLSRRYPAPVGIDVSAGMLALARRRCPGAAFVLGDVTADPSLAPGPYDLITAFRFFLNAEPALQAATLAWMRGALRPGGLVLANFHLNPRSLRGTYLRLRVPEGRRPPMAAPAESAALFAAHGFTVRAMAGYSFLPYRREGRHLLAPAARRVVELKLAGRPSLLPVSSCFLVVASCGG